MIDALKDIFENRNVNTELSLRKQLSSINMTRQDSIASYFMKIYELKDELGTIGEIVADKYIFMMTLNGLPHSWEPFI